MKKIYKYQLSHYSVIQPMELPKGSKILSAKAQYGNPVLYAILDPESNEYEQYDILLQPTGIDLAKDIDDYTFIDTVIFKDGTYTLHIFYRKVK